MTGIPIDGARSHAAPALGLKEDRPARSRPLRVRHPELSRRCAPVPSPAARPRRRGGRPVKLTPALRRRAEAMLRDTKGYPFVSDVIRGLPVGRTAFYRHFPKERIRELRG